MGLLARNRRAFDAETRGSERRKYFSPATYCQFAIMLPIAKANARGALLDVGAGDVPYRAHLQDLVTRYDTVDREKRIEDIDFEADAQDMSAIPSERYGTVLLIEALEHVPDPGKVLAELHRVLRPGGRVVLSVPHLSRLHEEPHDYYRFTVHGLRHLLTQAGFEAVDVVPRGGLFCFLGHQLSTALVCSTWHVPGLKRLAFALNKWAVVRPAFWLDQKTDRHKLFALGYVVTARRP